MNNSYDLYSNVPSNNSQFPFYQQYYYPPNGYEYSFPVAPHQRIWTQPYSNERPMVYSNFSYQSNEQQQQANNSNRLYHPNNQRRKCYHCGSSNHLIAQCTQFQTNTVQR